MTYEKNNFLVDYDCQRFTEDIFPYLDGKLTAEKTACFLAHSQECAACAKALEVAQNFEFNFEAALELIEPPADFAKQVMAALPQSQKAAGARIYRFPLKRWVGGIGTVAAAAVLVFGISLANPTVDIPFNPNPVAPVVAEQDKPVTPPVVSSPTPEKPVVVAEKPTPVEKPAAKPSKPVLNGTIQKPIVQKPVENGGSGNVAMPRAAYGVASDGVLATRLLADFGKGEKIYAPAISSKSDAVSYYTKNDDGVFFWKSSLLAPGEPECLGKAETKDDTPVDSLLKNTCPTYEINTSVFSPDKSMMAMNSRGDEEGVWVSNVGQEAEPWMLCGEGGGKILAWSPNGAKLLFTDKDDKLYVGYPVEKRIFIITEAAVLDLVWGKDSKTVVMTTKPSGKSGTSLITVQIP